MTAKVYLDRVDVALADLPRRQRRELVAELEAHLAEFPSDANLVKRLGSPERYAAELRDAAGLEAQRGVAGFFRPFLTRSIVITVAVVIAVGLGIYALAWIHEHQRIVPGDSHWYPPDSKPALGWEAQSVHFRKGKPFEVGVSFVNAGPFTVHVSSVGLSDDHFDGSDVPISKRRWYLAGPEPNTGRVTEPREPVHAFDLAPGQRAAVILKGVYREDCLRSHKNDGGEFWEMPGFFVHYNSFWRSGVAEVAFPRQINIIGPPGESCP